MQPPSAQQLCCFLQKNKRVGVTLILPAAQFVMRGATVQHIFNGG